MQVAANELYTMCNVLDVALYRPMLGWIITFLVIALIAGVLGFGGIAGASAGIAQILFYVFLVVLLISLLLHFTRGAAR